MLCHLLNPLNEQFLNIIFLECPNATGLTLWTVPLPSNIILLITILEEPLYPDSCPVNLFVNTRLSKVDEQSNITFPIPFIIVLSGILYVLVGV